MAVECLMENYPPSKEKRFPEYTVGKLFYDFKANT
jgi:hypothetical protein